jgi:hypothetical protein
VAAPVSKPGRQKSFTVRIPPGLFDQLTEIAKARGVARHDLVTVILRQWVSLDEETKTRTEVNEHGAEDRFAGRDHCGDEPSA